MARIKPTLLTARTLIKSRLFSLEELHLRFANGQERKFERIIGTNPAGAVIIVPLLDDDTVLLIREYGAGINDYYLGLPKGVIEPGEDPLAAANREMQEEVGYGARSLILLKPLATSPGYMAGKMQLVMAHDLYQSQLPGDEPEDIEVVPWRLSNLAELIKRADFCEGRSIAALFMVREILHNSGRN